MSPFYSVSAQIQHRSGISSAKLFFTTDPTGVWQSVDMQMVSSGSEHTWLGAIPKQAAGSTVYYYIEATANNGKTLTRPITAPAGWWSFCVTQSSGVSELARIEMADVYPNPASAITVVPVKTNRKTQATISLVNMQGQMVEIIFSGEIPEGTSNYFFQASKYAPGIYFVDFQADGVRRTQKVVIR